MGIRRLLVLATAALVSLAAAPPPVAPEAPAPADDPLRPEHLGTPAKSAAALPAWQPRPLRQLSPGEVPYAPESENAGGLYAKASTTPTKVGPLRDAALACSVDFGERHFDDLIPFASPEMVKGDICAVAGIPVGKGPLRHVTVAFGPDDANTATFLIPLASLDIGQPVVVRLIDIDLQFDDSIDTLRVPYRGTLPLSLATRGMKGECRHVAREALEAALPPYLAKADAALEKALKDFHPSLTEHNPASVDAALTGPQGPLAQAAALVGWDDPRVAARVSRIAELDQAFAVEWGKVFDAALEKSASKDWTAVADGQLEVRVAAVRCGKDLSAYRAMTNLPSERPADACALNVGLRNKTDRSLRVMEPLSQLKIFDRRGASRDVRFDGLWRAGRGVDLPFESTLAPGAEAEYVVLPSRFDDVLRQSHLPVLLRGAQATNLSNLGPGSIALSGGKQALDVVDYTCDDAALERPAEAAGVPKWRRPLCGLRVRMENRDAQPLPLKALPTRDFLLYGADAANHRAAWCVDVVALDPAPRLFKRDDALAPGAKLDLLFLYEQKEAPPSLDKVRLGLPKTPGHFFLSSSGP